MKQFFVLGIALLALSGCATRGYVRRQAAKANEQVNQVQTATSALAAKHESDVSRVNERLAAADDKIHQTAMSAAQANANAAQANANAARADASAALANANVARAEATAALADASAARAAAANAVVAQNTPPPTPMSSQPTTLPKTGSPLPLIGLSGLFSLGAAGALRFLRR